MSNLEMPRGTFPINRRRQRGTSLVELLVGMTIGLIVIGAAMGSLLLARLSSGSVSDLGQLQQQGAYALRVIGQQLRQAGSVVIGPSPDMPGGFEYVNTAVGLDGGAAVTSGTEGASGAPDAFTVGNLPSAAQRRNCLGEEASGARMDSHFYIENGQLRCSTPAGTGTRQQAIIANVADMQVNYRVQRAGKVQLLDAQAVASNGLWPAVTGIEICLDLQSDETNHPDPGGYRDCQGEEAARGGRLHLVLRNLFALRTQAGG